MTKRRDEDELRARALARLAAATADEATSTPSLLDMHRMIHELQVHQIELELQNEELVQARDAIEVGLSRYADLYEHAPIGYMTLGRSGEVLQLNLEASRLLGRERARLVGRPLGALLTADQRPALDALLVSMAHGGRSACEVRLERDGVAAIVELAGVRIDSGESFRVLATDVTEARRATRALHESELRYRTLFELSREALVTLAPPSWRFTSGNAAALALFGAREAALRSRSMADMSPATQPDGTESRTLTAEHLEPAMRDGARVFDWTLRRDDGVEFPATVSLTRMDVDGVPTLHASVRDETESRAQRARMAQADRLASLGLLAAGVAHEVNNPLAYVLYNLETVAADLPPLATAISRCAAALREVTGAPVFEERVGPGVERLADAALDDLVERTTQALRGTERIREVVRGLATFSRTGNIEHTRVDLERTLGAAIALASNEIRHRARLVTELEAMPAVAASEGKLCQVLLNLLINAAHALDDCASADPRVTVRAWTDDQGACVSVADNGGGIAPENLAHIFEPFFTTKGIGKGSGLGLAISRNLVEELGGSLSVESALGVGTTFVVRLPAFTQTDPDPRRSPAPGPATPKVRGRILVVDDEQQLRNTFVRLLGEAHEVVLADSGAQAQAILSSDTGFDVILCDLMMPGMTGMQLHAWICEQSETLAARVVFVTGGAFTDRAAEYVERVGNLKIEKPFQFEHVRRLVSELVAAARK